MTRESISFAERETLGLMDLAVKRGDPVLLTRQGIKDPAYVLLVFDRWITQGETSPRYRPIWATIERGEERGPTFYIGAKKAWAILSDNTVESLVMGHTNCYATHAYVGKSNIEEALVSYGRFKEIDLSKKPFKIK